MSDIYWFYSDKLFPASGSASMSPIDVESMTLRCHDVVRAGNDNFMGADTWEFRVAGREGLFETHYEWALILDVPENLERIRSIRKYQAQSQAIRARIKQHFRDMVDARNVKG